MARMDERAVDSKGQEIVEQAYELIEIVKSAYRQGTALHKVEKELFDTLLNMGYQAVEWLFERHGPCDLGEQVELSDGQVVRRLATTADASASVPVDIRCA